MAQTLNDLFKEISENPTKIDDLSIEDVERLNRTLSLLKVKENTTKNENKNYYCFSNLPVAHEYMRDICSVSIVGFLYRALHEYGNRFEDSDPRAVKIRQQIIHEFLDYYFNFNPEKHMRPRQWEDKPSLRNPDTNEPIPDDLFDKWRNYENAHYDDIAAVVNTAFPNHDAIDHAMIVFDQTFKSAEDAENYRKKKSYEYGMIVNTAETDQWVIITERKANREKLEFFNQNNQLLKAILDKRIEDRKIGDTLMRDRVFRKKKRELIKHGPRPDDFEDYAKENNGGIPLALTEDQKKELELLEIAIREGRVNPQDVYENVDSDGVPNDAIVIDTFTVDQTGKMTKSQIYSKAYSPADEVGNLNK